MKHNMVFIIHFLCCYNKVKQVNLVLVVCHSKYYHSKTVLYIKIYRLIYIYISLDVITQCNVIRN